MGKSNEIAKWNQPAALHQISWAFRPYSYTSSGGESSWNSASGAEGPTEMEFISPSLGHPSYKTGHPQHVSDIMKKAIYKK